MANLKYKVVLIITLLLISLSVGSSIVNYIIAINSTQEQLKNNSLPLSIDNIFSEIQKNIIQPNLVSSMMAHDTFLKDWLVNEEQDTTKISKYLDTIKNKYGMFSTFLVSEKSHNYYTHNGFLETISSTKEDNNWYFKFKESQKHNEVNMDYNKMLDNSMIMFINYKIFDDQFHFIGATGIGLKISYIDSMLKKFRQKYNFNVYFINENGDVILSEKSFTKIKNIKEIKDLEDDLGTLFFKDSKIIEFTKNNKKYMLNSKYIEDLNLYLIVEADVDFFTKKLKETFYFNLLISLFITAIVAWIIIYTIRNYNKKLESLANFDTLTSLVNRRFFNDYFNHFLHSYKRSKKPFSIIFFDIDDFKAINDEFGHLVGDKVLQEVAKILKTITREADITARWGGEEFAILIEEANTKDACTVAEKIRFAIESNLKLSSMVNKSITASFGVATIKDTDTQDSFLKRVDDALYKAKISSKNRVEVL